MVTRSIPNISAEDVSKLRQTATESAGFHRFFFVPRRNRRLGGNKLQEAGWLKQNAAPIPIGRGRIELAANQRQAAGTLAQQG